MKTKPSIAEVLKHFYGIEAKERAGWQKMLCPLHAEENPSASVSTEKQRWSCFVCDVSEDSYDVIQREEGIGFREAQEFAHTRFGGGGEDLLPPVRGESRRGVHGGPRPGQRRGEVPNRLRRFGSYWP
ncbi:CHC2 zinc finger domain-containing protein [Streptomyces graminilatus]|uniref:CHC2 zinc finger domain-containing protein n=1 Tax=Streptomyces graminilatus TaxID=1464070 RepID=UPI00099F1CBB